MAKRANLERIGQMTIFPYQVGDRLKHKPTGRTVEVARVEVDHIKVHTLDDRWPHPKTGEERGGCTWILLPGTIDREFKREEEEK